MNKETKKNKDIEYFYDKNRFINFLSETKMYKELYSSREALISFVIASFFTFLLYFILKNTNDFNALIEHFFNLIGLSISGLFGLLSFVVCGLALIVGSIGTKIIKVIDSKKKFISLLRIIFRFYFVGAVIGFTIILDLLFYVVLLIPIELNYCAFIIGCLFLFYCLFFSIISAIMLMGSCIRLLLLEYSINEKDVQ